MVSRIDGTPQIYANSLSQPLELPSVTGCGNGSWAEPPRFTHSSRTERWRGALGAPGAARQRCADPPTGACEQRWLGRSMPLMRHWHAVHIVAGESQTPQSYDRGVAVTSSPTPDELLVSSRGQVERCRT